MGHPAWNPAIPSTLPTRPWESYLFSLCSSLLSIPIKFSTNMDANGISRHISSIVSGNTRTQRISPPASQLTLCL